jgi:hypothetical protein
MAFSSLLSSVASLGGVATLLAAGLYGLLRLSYVVYYAQFGLSPEDVGIGSVQILTDNAVPLLIFLGVFSGAVVIVPATLAAAAVTSMPEAMRSPTGMRARRALAKARGPLIGGLGVAALLLIIQGVRFIAVGPGVAKADAKCAIEGYASGGQSIGVRGLTDVTFGFRTLAASVTATSEELKDEAIGAPSSRPRRPNLLFLGQANGQVILWDPGAQVTVRAPQADVIVRIHDDERVGTRPRVRECENVPTVD